MKTLYILNCIAAVLSLFCLTSINANAVIRTWDGHAPFVPNWSQGLNWNPGGVPQSGDYVVYAMNNEKTNGINDLSGLLLDGLAVSGGCAGFGGCGYAFLSGNSVTVSNGITQLNALPSYINIGINLGGDQTFYSAGNLYFNGTIDLKSFYVTINATNNVTFDTTNDLTIISSNVTGAGGLTKTGFGRLVFTGSAANTYTGTTAVNEGTLILSNAGFNQAIVGPLVIGDGFGGADADVVLLERVRQIGNTVPVTINSSGLLVIGSGKSDAFGSLSGAGNVVFEGAGTLEVGLDDGSSTFDGIISGPGAFWKEGAGTLTLNGNNTYTGTTFVDGSGTLIVNGSQAQSPVTISGGATLGGSGTVGAITANNGIISPGASAGILKCSSVTLDASCIFQVELNGTTAGTGHDRLDVNGTVNLSDATLHATLGFASAVGNTFRIVNKTVGGAIFTTFAGLAEGATFNISGIPFQISYAGGNGNDVVLTQLLPPPSLNPPSVAGTNLILSWPTNYTGFVLECNTNLSTNVWTVVVPAPIINGSNYVVTNSTTVPQKFFRLRSP